MKKLAVIGSRTFNNYNILCQKVNEYCEKYNIDMIVSGGAHGADSLARKYADEHNIPICEFLPEYEKYGHKAPIIRNVEIINHADVVLAFWDGFSKGTFNALQRAFKRGLPMHVIQF